MKIVRFYFSFLIVSLLAISSIPGLAKDSPPQKTAMDLQKTAEYVKSWSNRPSFPDSVTLAYYYTYGIGALGEKIAPEQKKAIIEFIKKCQKESGGFASEPSYSKNPNVIFTYYALKALSLLDSVKSIDRKKATGFLSGLVRTTGGIAAQNRKGDHPTLATTYYGLESLRMLGESVNLDKEKSVAFIKQYKAKDKGYSMLAKGGAASSRATFMALSSLDILGALSAKDKQESGAFLLETRYAGEIDGKKYLTLPQLRQMSFTIQALIKIAALDKANTTGMYNFVESLYVPENGGFGPEPGLGTTPPSTYDALFCLVQLGKLSTPEAADN